MKLLINSLNKLSDMDNGWKPFLFLRPEKHQTINFNHLLKMSIYYGGFFGTICFGLAAAQVVLNFNKLSGLVISSILIGSIVAPIVLFFLCWGLIFGIAWNIRAKELQATDLSKK